VLKVCVLLTLVAVTGCAGARSGSPGSIVSVAPSSSWAPEDASQGIVDAQLGDLFRREWAWQLESAPELATQLGIHRFDDRIADNSPEGLAAQRAARRGFLDEARAIAASATLVPSDRTALELLIGDLEANIATEVCAFEAWSFSAAENPVTHWNYLPEEQPVTTPQGGDALLARYASIDTSIDRDIESLRGGLGRGLVANAESTRRVIDMFDKQLAQPLADWPLLDPTEVEHADWPPAAQARFRERLRELVAQRLQPAFARYRALLRDEILPRARGDEAVGLVHLPNGEACYRASARAFTTLERSPAELHELGLREIARIDAELTESGHLALGSTSLLETLRRLRTDPSLFFSSAEEIEDKARRALERARSALPRAFGTLPKAECVVSRIPDYEAPYSTIAYYRQPVPDGSKPGQYFVNVYRPETRPRFEASVLAFHESIPGHHVQIAIAQELPAVPAFLKNVAPSAFVEGWALYTERLADELGLYEGALDRLGMLSFDAWRAARLVVDTGIHSQGWSRQRAVDFMLAHTALSPGNISNEVDRYIVWPGQALAYKVGQLTILELREQARTKLGARFDLREFHDAVLLGGGVSLPVLRRQVEAYIARRAAVPPS
jgi:uncharacterized protein (DUF885 family)